MLLSILSQLQRSSLSASEGMPFPAFNSFPVAAACGLGGFSALFEDFQFFPSCSDRSRRICRRHREGFQFFPSCSSRARWWSTTCRGRRLSILSQLQRW
jgi:hypothetical protein